MHLKYFCYVEFVLPPEGWQSSAEPVRGKKTSRAVRAAVVSDLCSPVCWLCNSADIALALLLRQRNEEKHNHHR